MGGDVATILEAGVALAVIGGILVALADTRFYGVAFAMVGIALVYVLLEHPAVATALEKAVAGAASKLGGKSG